MGRIQNAAPRVRTVRTTTALTKKATGKRDRLMTTSLPLSRLPVGILVEIRLQDLHPREALFHNGQRHAFKAIHGFPFIGRSPGDFRRIGAGDGIASLDARRELTEVIGN